MRAETSGRREQRILLVDDDPELEIASTRALSHLGFTVEQAVEYEAITARILERHPDVVCVNLDLPRNSGYDVCDFIRADRRLDGVKIIVTSDRTTPAVIAFAEEAGADAFLRKPFTPEQLAKYVKALLEQPHLSRPSVRRLHRFASPYPG